MRSDIAILALALGARTYKDCLDEATVKAEQPPPPKKEGDKPRDGG